MRHSQFGPFRTPHIKYKLKSTNGSYSVIHPWMLSCDIFYRMVEIFDKLLNSVTINRSPKNDIYPFLFPEIVTKCTDEIVISFGTLFIRHISAH